jgi:hypothetical protein
MNPKSCLKIMVRKIHGSANYASKYDIYIYRVIHKYLLDVRPLRYISRDGHAEEEHVNRGRDNPSFCPTLKVLDSSSPLCLSWLLRSRVRKFRRDL